ncbi:MAG TPA: oligosaccharide flippase family protein [Bryobacteraceae bacterium]|nr:oligosaccharide flippase family protein [Bryobacteraceae bacterium]
MTRTARFIVNVVWNWLGVGVGLVAGLLLSPYLIRKLGADGYGIWALSFAIVEYYWLTDLGFRSATVKYVAHHSATGEHDKVREVVNTAITYAALIGAVILAAVLVIAPKLDKFFQIEPGYATTFPRLVVLITASWCLGAVFNVFGAAVDAVQRFDLTNRVGILGTVVRTAGTFVLLYYGRGLVDIGLMVVASQCLTYALHYWNYRRLFACHEISPRFANRQVLGQMARFGFHTFLGTISVQIANQSAPILIGHFRPTAFVGYYTLPVRLLVYTVEMVGRIGLVTSANAAELAARNDLRALVRLAIYPNRYCLMLYMPLAIVLWTYGAQLLRVWVGAAFAAQSAPVLPVLLAGSLLAIVGQFSSSMLLQGLGRHQAYSRATFVEAVAGVAAMIIVIPRFGILGAAWVSTIGLIINRAIFASWLTSRVIGVPVQRYLHDIYTRPLSTAVPILALALVLRNSFLPGNTWLELVSAAAILGSAYFILAFMFCVTGEDRGILFTWIRRLRFSQNSRTYLPGGSSIPVNEFAGRGQPRSTESSQ